MEGVTTRQITEAAHQRNTSAVSYHFGSRDGLLRAILARRGGPVDEERGRLLTGAGADPTLDDLVRSLVVPYAALLDDPGGRAYLRIVAQLRGRFSAWREASDASTTQHLAAILERVEAIPDAPPAVRRECADCKCRVYAPARSHRASSGDWAEAWASLHSDVSRPFDRPAAGRIAVKVINHLGDEVMKVFRVP